MKNALIVIALLFVVSCLAACHPESSRTNVSETTGSGESAPSGPVDSTAEVFSESTQTTTSTIAPMPAPATPGGDMPEMVTTGTDQRP